MGDFFGGVVGVIGGVLRKCRKHLWNALPERSEVQWMKGAVSVSDLAYKLINWQ